MHRNATTEITDCLISLNRYYQIVSSSILIRENLIKSPYGKGFCLITKNPVKIKRDVFDNTTKYSNENF